MYILANIKFHFSKLDPNYIAYKEASMSLYKVSATNEEIQTEMKQKDQQKRDKNELIPKWKKDIKFKLDDSF